MLYRKWTDDERWHSQYVTIDMRSVAQWLAYFAVLLMPLVTMWHVTR